MPRVSPAPRQPRAGLGSLGGGARGKGPGAAQTPPPARLRPAGRLPPCQPDYLVVVQPRLQNLMQLPRQRVAGLRRGPAGPIAEAAGSPGWGRRDNFPAGLGHSVAGPPPARCKVHLSPAAPELRMRTVCCRACAIKEKNRTIVQGFKGFRNLEYMKVWAKY